MRLPLRLYRNGRFFPLDGKIPLRAGNWREAHEDAKCIETYRNAGYNVGYVIPRNVAVLDVDTRNGGLESYENLCDAVGTGDLSDVYPTVQTGGGGLHVYLRLPAGQDGSKFVTKSSAYRGIDLKKWGGYVVASTGIHPDTKQPYITINDPETWRETYPAILEPWKRAKEHEPQFGEAETVDVSRLRSILKRLDPENYRDNDSWFALMCGAHNATGGDPDAREAFVRWSTDDPVYAHDAQTIRGRWDSLSRSRCERPRTIATLYRELPESERAIEQTREGFGALPPEQIAEVQATIEAVASAPEADLAYVLAKEVQRRYRLMLGSDDRYWQFAEDSHCWRPISKRYVQGMISKTYQEIGRTKSIASMLPATEMVLGGEVVEKFVPGSNIDPDKSTINVSNGTIWIDNITGRYELRPHNPDDFLISSLPIEYDPSARCPRFNRFMGEIFEPLPDAPEVIRHMLEMMGYILQTEKNHAVIMVLHGNGANGKSTLFDVMKELLAEAALSKSIRSLDEEKNSHALACLPGKLAVIDDDVHGGSLPDGMLKKLSESKWLSANPKFGNEFRFRNTATPVLIANRLPSTTDLSDGMKRRLHIFRFERNFENEGLADSRLKVKLLHELPGILNVLLTNLRHLRKRGHFDIPDSVLAARDNWFESQNDLARFVRMYFEADPGVGMLLDEAWSSYKSFVVVDNVPKYAQLRRREFGTNLAMLGLKQTGGRIPGYRLRPQPLAL